MVNPQKDYFILYISILQKRKFGIKVCFHGNSPFLCVYIDSRVFSELNKKLFMKQETIDMSVTPSYNRN